MHRVLHLFTQRLAHYLALLGFTGLLILSVMVVLDIILRTVADFPLKGVNDISAMVMAVVIAACIPQSLLVKQSISVEVLGQVLGGRMRLLLDVIASLAVFVFFLLLAWQFIPYAASVTDSGERTWVLHWPVGPWWYAATACFIVSALVQLLVLIDDTVAFVVGHPWAAASRLIDGAE